MSGISLMELALLNANQGRRRIGIDDALEAIEVSETIQVLPLTVDIAREITPLIGLLRDPSDCVIVATARVHGLRLLTSDQRIFGVESGSGRGLPAARYQSISMGNRAATDFSANVVNKAANANRAETSSGAPRSAPSFAH